MNPIQKERQPLQPADRFFLLCGIISSLYYVGLNIIVPMMWPEYSSKSQTVSELSAVGAPTRMLWVWLSIPYTFLVIAFAYGVWKSANGNRHLRIAGLALILYSLLNVLWPFTPMHLRDTLAAGGATFTDTMHIALAVATEILFLLALLLAAKALGRKFRIYSILTVISLLIFGILTFRDAPAVELNQPTPMIGVWERINVGLFIVWVIVLAIVLLQRNNAITINLIRTKSAEKTHSYPDKSNTTSIAGRS